MNQVPDRMKLRREYLKKKGRVRFKRALGYLLVSGVLLFAGTLTYLLVSYALDSLDDFTLASCSLLAVCMACISIDRCWRAFRNLRQGRQVSWLIYIPPPIIVDILSAEEMLVRSSEEPRAGKETLVRPAASMQKETPQKELLRPRFR